jgi:hypothetical protein
MSMDRNVTYTDYPYDDDTPPRELQIGGHVMSRMVRLALLPVSLILWGVGVAHTNTSTLGPYGLPANLPIVFYLGIALLIVSAGIELARAELSQLRLGLHSGSLVLMLYGTAALVYSAGRYSWLYKTIGVVQHVSANGHLTPGLDIYQSWPGFFALASWFDRVAGVSSPLAYAKWSQMVIELAALPLLYSIYGSLALPVRHRWLGLMLYSAGNWIAQDYFSPQALSIILSLGIFAITLRWMVSGNAPGYLGRDDEEMPADGKKRRRRGPTPLERRGAIPFIVALLLLFFVLVFTHELSPYIVTIQLIALAVVGQMRPRWIPLAALVITIGYLLPNFSYVNSHFGLLSSFGNFFSNIASPSASDPGTMPESEHIIGHCADLLSVGMWLLALVGAWRRRNSRRTVIALLFLTFSPVFVLVGGAYGNEGILRVYLFSLPWAAALATSALLPLHPLSQVKNSRGRHAEREDKWEDEWEAPSRISILAKFDRGTLRAPIALACAVALFFPAFYGNDSSNVMPQSQVDVTEAFQEHATPGIVMLPIDNTTLSDTAQYNEWPAQAIFGAYGVLATSSEKINIATYLARTAVNYTSGITPSYVLITPSMLAANAAYGYVAPADMNALLAQLRTSRYWKIIVNTDGTMIYELTSAADSIPPGPYNAKVFFSVP